MGGGILREEILSGRLEGSMLQLQEGEERGEGINLEKELGEDTLISRGAGCRSRRVKEEIFRWIGRDTVEDIKHGNTGYRKR